MLKENQYTLLKLLLNEHEYQSAEYFAAGLDVSTKTIQNYLQQMEPYFAAHQYQLLRKRGRGLRLLSTVKKDRSETKMEALHQDSASLRREKLKLFLLFNFNGYTRKTSIKQLVAKYFVGKNSIVADLNTIKPQLMEYQLQLIRDKDGTQIKGRRKNIKTAILDSFHRFQKELLFDNLAEFQTDNPLDKIIFDNHLKEVVLILIEEMQKDYGYQFDRDFKYSFLINLMVDIKLFGAADCKKLETLDYFPDEAAYFQYYLQQRLGFVFQPAYDTNRIVEYLIVFQKDASKQRYFTSITHAYTADLLADLAEILHERIEVDEELQVRLTEHINDMLLRQRYRVKIFQDDLGELIEKFPQAFLALAASMWRLAQKYGLQMQDNDEIGQVLVIFLTFDRERRPSKSAVILYHAKLEIARLTAKLLEKALPEMKIEQFINRNQQDQAVTASDVLFIVGEQQHEHTHPSATTIYLTNSFHDIAIQGAVEQFRSMLLKEKWNALQKRVMKHRIWQESEELDKGALLQSAYRHLPPIDHAETTQQAFANPIVLFDQIAVVFCATSVNTEPAIYLQIPAKTVKWTESKLPIQSKVRLIYYITTTEVKDYQLFLESLLYGLQFVQDDNT